MDNLEKLATYGSQDDENKNTTQICVGHHYTETNTNNVNKTCYPSLLTIRLTISS